MKPANNKNSETNEKIAKENMPAKQDSKSSEKLAIIRIRGQIGIKKPIKDTMEMLKIYRKNYCTVVDKNSCFVGMAKKIKDYATYGEIDSETYKLLIEKRGEIDSKGELKKFFRLTPPKHGFERKGVKFAYTKGGALGYRGKEINKLIKKML
jgi:large subunit ribosomal protein L30